EVGVGECAGVIIDLVAILLLESEEKIENAKQKVAQGKLADGIYLAYTSFINTAKALLIAENEKTNTHAGIIAQFDEVFVNNGKIQLPTSFSDLVYQINKNEPSEEFASKYINEAASLYEQVNIFRNKEVLSATE